MPEGHVFLTGALGFIGRAVADRYAAEGWEVRGVDLTADPERGVVAGDVTRPGPWQDHAAECEVVIHLAARIGLGGTHDEFWPINVLATRLALDAAVRGGARRFVHTSSIVTFGNDFPDGVAESHPVRPTGAPYTDTKIASEQVVLAAHAGREIPCTIVRPGDVYGPRSRPWVILTLEAIRARQFVLPARGRGIFSPVYVDNLVDGYVLAASAAEAEGQVFTITDGIGVECREFFAHHHRWLGVKGPRTLPTGVAVAIAGASERAMRLAGRSTEANAGAARYLARTGTYSIEKARTMLGYEPAVGLAEGLERSRAWAAGAGLL
ncbi:MAG: NAD(P)-dependent oxidoreductase [Actinomycetota bacterium]|nr:NAD(P)-dependent oxidoreductase [Actinomycetota bacterium]